MGGCEDWQLPLICTETLSFLESPSASHGEEPSTPSVATAVLDHPTTLRVLDRMFGNEREDPFQPITDIIMVQNGEEVPAGYTRVSDFFP